MDQDLSLEQFENEFENMGMSFPPELHFKATELCERYSLSAEEFVESWFAYKHSHSKTVKELDIASLESLERERLQSTLKKTPKTKTRKRLNDTTPEEANKIQALSIGGEKGRVGTPLRSLSTATPQSAKYSSRKDRGKVLFSTNQLETSTQSQATQSQVSQSQETDQTSLEDWNRKDPLRLVGVSHYYADYLKPNVHYMYQRMTDKTNVLNYLIADMMERYRGSGLVDSFQPINSVFQDSQPVIGRIGLDTSDRRLFLEEHLSGITLEVNLSLLKDYLLLPGQIVAMECTNPNGVCLNALKLIDNIYPPLAPIPSHMDEVSMVIACGPYTTQDSLCYEPLDDLLLSIQSACPDVCVLMGPFVDASLAEALIDEDLQGLFHKIINRLTTMAEKLNLHMIIVPSQRDLFHDPVYPQPPFKYRSSPHITFTSDPSTLLLDNSLVLALTSTDVLFHATKDNISKTQGSIDRMSRLIQCLLSQHNYYPLYPPSADLGLDLGLFDSFGGFDITPHLLITPSELKHFVKSVNGCTCVNPGRLAKSESGGTFARVVAKVINNDDKDNHETRINNDTKSSGNSKIDINVQIVKV